MKWLLPRRNRVTAYLGAGVEEPCIKFDESSGQIYSETTAVIPTSDDRNWARDSRIVKGARYLDKEKLKGYTKRLAVSRGNTVVHQERLDGLKNSRTRGSRGSRTLQAAAIECILENIVDITLEAIECLPISIARRVWHAVIARCSMSFYIWNIFSKVLGRNTEYMDLLKYQEVIQCPNSPLEVYINPLTSMSYDFITSLSITTAFPVSDLIKLTSVKNIGALEIINTTGVNYYAVGDRLLRSWHQAAVEKSAFSILRILRLWNHEGVTEKSLTYLNGFQALAVYDVKGCGFGRNSLLEATHFGWKAVLETNILGLFEKSCMERALLLNKELGIKITSRLETDPKYLRDSSRVKRISRADVRMFLANRPAIQSAFEADMNHAHHPENETTGSNEKELVIKTFTKSQNAQKPRHDSQGSTWDISLYRTFARIGELRNDSDLLRAGVFLGDQAIVGEELVNSHRVVSLRLGVFPMEVDSSSIRNGHGSSNSGFGWSGKRSLATSYSRGLAFIRIEIPSPDFPPKENKVDSPSDIMMDPREMKPSSSQPPRIRRNASGVVKSKKRKLEDVLRSFV